MRVFQIALATFVIYSTLTKGDEGRNILAHYCGINDEFRKHLQAGKQPGLGEFSPKNIAFSGMAISMNFVLRNGFSVRIQESKENLSCGALLELRILENDRKHDDKDYEFVITHDKCKNFAETFFSCLREIVIAMKISDILNSEKVANGLTEKEFNSLYQDVFIKSSSEVLEDIKEEFSPWIKSEGIELNVKNWEDEINQFKVNRVLVENRTRNQAILFNGVRDFLKKKSVDRGN